MLVFPDQCSPKVPIQIPQWWSIHTLPTSAKALLAPRSPKSRSLICFKVCIKSFGYIPSTKSLKGLLVLNVSDRHLITSLQKIRVFGHSQRQWRKVPFSFKRFAQTSGTLADLWWSMTGVMHILINHLHWSNSNLVFIVCFWVSDGSPNCVVNIFGHWTAHQLTY